MKDFDLLIIGEINPDLILGSQDIMPAFGQAEKLVDSAVLTIGASSAIMACGAARLGLRTAFLGLVGDDLFGHYMLEAMAERGVDVSACVVATGKATGFSVILTRGGGDRAILTFGGCIPDLALDHIDEVMIGRTRHLHVGGYFLLDNLRPALPDLFVLARQQGATTSLDTNWDPSGTWTTGRLLDHCDLFLPNEAEARHITGQEDLDRALDVLAQVVPLVVVKMGARGALARQGESSVSLAPPEVQVVDTVGAGDSFDAGFLYGYLHNWPLAHSLKLGLACGTLSTRAAGGTAAQPTLEEAADWIGLEVPL